MLNTALDLEPAIRINETDAPLTQEQRNYISDVGEHAMALRRALARAEQVLSLLIEATCGGEVSTPLEALKDAKPLSWYASGGELSTMVVYEEEQP